MPDTDPMISQLFMEFGKFSNKLDDLSNKQSDTALAVAVVLEKIADLPDHEKRIRVLETEKPDHEELRLMKRQIAGLMAWRYKLLGAAGTISLIVGAVGVYVGHVIH